MSCFYHPKSYYLFSSYPLLVGNKLSFTLIEFLFGRVLAEKLNLNYEEAERWIVNLIRSSKLDAKIDSQSGTVIMEPNHPNV